MSISAQQKFEESHVKFLQRSLLVTCFVLFTAISVFAGGRAERSKVESPEPIPTMEETFDTPSNLITFGDTTGPAEDLYLQNGLAWLSAIDEWMAREARADVTKTMDFNGVTLYINPVLSSIKGPVMDLIPRGESANEPESYEVAARGRYLSYDEWMVVGRALMAAIPESALERFGSFQYSMNFATGNAFVVKAVYPSMMGASLGTLEARGATIIVIWDQIGDLSVVGKEKDLLLAPWRIFAVFTISENGQVQYKNFLAPN